MNEDLEAIRQEHESWLGELEGLAVEAIATNNWDAFYAHLVEFQNENDLHGETGIAITQNPTVRISALEASTKSLSRSGADLLPTTEQNERKELDPSCHQPLTTSPTTLIELTDDMEGKRA
jgi:hypothetical protein